MKVVVLIECVSHHNLTTDNHSRAPNSFRVNHRKNRNDHTILRNKNSRTAFNSDYNLQRDYIAATVGKEVQLDCKIKNLVNEDDKVWYFSNMISFTCMQLGILFIFFYF
jgi:hypothetical protein